MTYFHSFGAIWTLVLAILATPSPTSAASLDDDLNTVWESLWDERGTPRRAVRWYQGPRYRIVGVDAQRHRASIEGALAQVAQATGLTFTDVSSESGAEAAATLDIEVVANTELLPNAPCIAQLQRVRDGAIERVVVRMRTGLVWHCIHHEMMHAMGIAGHPSGKTVLSYFPWRVDTLMDLDRNMLASLYSARMPRGATPLQALVALSEGVLQAAGAGTVTPQSRAVAQQFLLARLREMEAFAAGTGDVPLIIKRSGKASGDHMAQARLDMGLYLGQAYEQGTIVERDPSAAARWLGLAAEGGQHVAQLLLARMLRQGTGITADKMAAHKWLSASARAGNTVAPRELEALERTLSPEELTNARAAAPR